MARVRDIMARDVVTVGPKTSVSELIRTLDAKGIHGVPVVEEEDVLAGVVSIRDVLRLAGELGQVPEAARWGLGMSGGSVLQAPVRGDFHAYYVTPSGEYVDVRDQVQEFPGDLFEGYRVEDIMTRSPVTIEPDASLSELARLLLERNIHRALVLEGDALQGVVTATDALKALAEG